MAHPPHTFQPPPGTRDFYPEDMALRRYIEDTWRRVSLRHGFVEVDGPTFEYLDLYKVKSGDEIVSQLFHFESRGEDKTQFALRPEFTPTLARMVAAKANSLPRPIKWFSIPRCYRAERPQKGRLREFIQWNVDMLGGDSAEVRRQLGIEDDDPNMRFRIMRECMAVCIDAIKEFGFTSKEVKLLWNNRAVMSRALRYHGFDHSKIPTILSLIDKLDQLDENQRRRLFLEHNFSVSQIDLLNKIALGELPLAKDTDDLLKEFTREAAEVGIAEFCRFDPRIVRGLEYYTGFVFEVFDAEQPNLVVAGGGQNNNLIETFGGPSLSAAGFGMHDVAIEILLRKKGKLPASVDPEPSVSFISPAELHTNQWNTDHPMQPPPGTRDFYPEQMALRRYMEDTWRRVSLRHGFVEVDGPTFEYLDLYKVKSGDEIVSQLFHFESRGEDKTQFALRPEFTPTLARMVAAKANSLPRPIKWFSIPRCYRAERPQKGRLREFIQWNVDIIGGATLEQREQFDLEIVALALDCLREFGIKEEHINLSWNNRGIADSLMALAGIQPQQYTIARSLIDQLPKLTAEQRRRRYDENGFLPHEREFFGRLAQGMSPLEDDFWKALPHESAHEYIDVVKNSKTKVENRMALMGFPNYARYDPSMVRGLAYYTGFVFEISDLNGEHRAIAGGGRYDKLIEMFGGPSLPAAGFGMGDVVLENLLREKGKLPANLFPKPDIYVISVLEDATPAQKLLADLRTSHWNTDHTGIVQTGLATITSYKATKNIGKLLQDASASGAKLAVILAPAEWERGVLKVKNLATRDEREVPKDEALEVIRTMVRALTA